LRIPVSGINYVTPITTPNSHVTHGTNKTRKRKRVKIALSTT